MALIIGENTYADTIFADEYIEENYLFFSPLRVHWSVLVVAEKEQYLKQSLKQLERLAYVGKKINASQKLQFPRIRSGGKYNPYAFGFLNSREVPTVVREAQVENALGIINNEINAVTDKQFMTLQALGIVKNTKYNKREAGDLGFSDELKGGSKNTMLASEKAYSLLRGWIGGSFKC